MNRILSFFTAIILCAAVVASITAIGITQERHNHWQELAQKLEAMRKLHVGYGQPDFSKREEVESTLWASNELTETEQMLRDDWTALENRTDKEDIKTYHRRQAMLASIYMNQSDFEKAIYCYNHLLEENKKNGANNPEIARDYNNIGTAYHLWGLACSDLKKQTQHFADAAKNYKEAESRFRKLNDSDGLYNNLASQYSLLHDGQKKREAAIVFADLNKIDTKPNKEFRDLLLEQK